MTPDRTTARATRLAVFHSSTRTALSLNTDPATGQRLQELTTSRLELCWVAGELRINCRASRVVMDASRPLQRSTRRARGML
mgnify:FL=1